MLMNIFGYGFRAKSISLFAEQYPNVFQEAYA